MTVADVLDAIEKYGAAELTSLVDGLCGCGALAKIPIDALLKLSADVARLIQAQSELEAMRAAVKTADTAADLAEQESLDNVAQQIADAANGGGS